jgi:hypothetical protein
MLGKRKSLQRRILKMTIEEKISSDDIKTARKAWKPPTKGLHPVMELGVPAVNVGDYIVVEYPAGWRDTVIGSIISMQTNGNFYLLEQGTTSHVGCNFYTGVERGIKFWKYDPKLMRVAKEQEAQVKVTGMGKGRKGVTPSGEPSVQEESPVGTEEPKRKRGRPRKNPVAE